MNGEYDSNFQVEKAIRSLRSPSMRLKATALAI